MKLSKNGLNLNKIMLLGTGYWVLGAGLYVLITGLSKNKQTRTQCQEPRT